MRTALLCLAVAAFAVGCSNDGEGAATTARTTTEPLGTAEPTLSSSVLVYFLRDGKVAAARRTVEHSGDVATAAVRALLQGPTAEEARAGLASAIARETRLTSLTIEDGSARIGLAQPEPDEEEANTTASVAQIVYTLTQFPAVRGVVYEGTRVLGPGMTRADMEDWTPAILVESPVVGETVRSPIRVSGTANTFEATLMLRVVGRGRKVAERFATATSGSGQRGTFDATIEVPASVTGAITLVAFESSAADGSEIHVVRVPLVLAR